VVTIMAKGLPSKVRFQSALAGLQLLKAIGKVKAQMKVNRPDVVLAMGSYASVGPVGAALRLGIPCVLHESNVIPGRAIRLLSRWSAVVAGCFDETRFYLRRRNLVITGMPLRADLLEAARTPRADAGGTPFRLLVMGGSRGAHRINELVSEALVRLKSEGQTVEVAHLTGEQDQAFIERRYREHGIAATVMAFTREMGAHYRNADFAVCRAGAATCAELFAFGLPALLIPYPHAIHDHQTANARAMEKMGAADMVPENDVTTDWLVSYLGRMMRDRERRGRMSEAAKAQFSGDGAVKLADVVERVAADGAYVPA